MIHINNFTTLLFYLCISILMTHIATAAEPTLYQSAPNDWRSEVVELPLSFAPDIDIKGIKELRFSPGMFSSDSDTYFTYSFIWWLEGEPVFDAERLAEDVTRYYQGIYKLVSQKQMDVSGFAANFHHVGSRKLSFFEGSAELIDPFVTEAPLVLNIKVEQSFCKDQGHTALFFKLSPQPFAGENWEVLDMQRAGECR